MANKVISDEVRQQVEAIVAQFNKTELNGKGRTSYVARFQGKYLYLDQIAYGRKGPICRLTFNGEMTKWGFAIYKYSDNRYDADEWFFPGSQHVNGTVEGAMRAGLEAYPS